MLKKLFQSIIFLVTEVVKFLMKTLLYGCIANRNLYYR